MNPKYLTYCKFNYNDTPPLIINRRKNSKPKHKPITKGSNTMKNIARKLVTLFFTLFFAICAGFEEILAVVFIHGSMKQKREALEQTRSYIESQDPKEKAGRFIPCQPETNMLDEIFDLQAVPEGKNKTPADVESVELQEMITKARFGC